FPGTIWDTSSAGISSPTVTPMLMQPLCTSAVSAVSVSVMMRRIALGARLADPDGVVAVVADRLLALAHALAQRGEHAPADRRRHRDRIGDPRGLLARVRGDRVGELLLARVPALADAEERLEHGRAHLARVLARRHDVALAGHDVARGEHGRI